MNVAVVGLGSMGYGMAASLLRSGHAVAGVDVNADAVPRFRAEGGVPDDAASIAADLDALVVVVLNAAQAEEVLFGADGFVARLPRGSVVLLCVTVAPDYARRAAERCAAHRIAFLDAPISGGSAKAAQGKLSIMASGTAEAFAKAQPLLDAMAETVFTLGDSAGAGSAMKAVNQMLAGVHIAAMAEAITFGMTQGVDPARFMEVIPRCAGREGDVTRRFEALQPLIGHVQIASVPDRGTPDHGELNYDHVFQRVAKLGWHAPIGAEYLPQDPAEPDLAWLKAIRATPRQVCRNTSRYEGMEYG